MLFGGVLEEKEEQEAAELFGGVLEEEEEQQQEQEVWFGRVLCHGKFWRRSGSNSRRSRSFIDCTQCVYEDLLLAAEWSKKSRRSKRRRIWEQWRKFLKFCIFVLWTKIWGLGGAIVVVVFIFLLSRAPTTFEERSSSTTKSFLRRGNNSANLFFCKHSLWRLRGFQELLGQGDQSCLQTSCQKVASGCGPGGTQTRQY